MKFIWLFLLCLPSADVSASVVWLKSDNTHKHKHTNSITSSNVRTVISFPYTISNCSKRAALSLSGALLVRISECNNRPYTRKTRALHATRCRNNCSSYVSMLCYLCYVNVCRYYVFNALAQTALLPVHMLLISIYVCVCVQKRRMYMLTKSSPYIVYYLRVQFRCVTYDTRNGNWNSNFSRIQTTKRVRRVFD